MTKVKFFSKTLSPRLSFFMKPLEGLQCGMEEEINHWLTNNPLIVIRDIHQTMSGGSWAPAKLVITVWYTEKTEKKELTDGVSHIRKHDTTRPD